MKENLILQDKNYISAKRAAEIFGYASDYIGQLCRSGKVECKMVGRSWFVTKESLVKHRISVSPELFSGIDEKEIGYHNFKSYTNSVTISDVEIEGPLMGKTNEADAASWLTLRGSVTQTVLLDTSKVETTPVAAGTDSEFAPGTNNTTVAFGAGLKFNKVTVDGALLAAGSQTLNTSMRRREHNHETTVFIGFFSPSMASVD